MTVQYVNRTQFVESNTWGQAMPKVAKQLTALEVSRLSGKGRYSVGCGLYLKIENEHSKSWVLIATVGDKRRNIGLGAYPKFSLAQAREKASKARELIEQGIDPIEQKKATRSAIKAAQAKEITFKQCATAYIDSQSHAWKNPRHHAIWTNSLRDYAYPVIGDMLMRDIEQVHILKILKPIWTEKTETAGRVRRRIEAVLSYAAVSGYRDHDNPARWRGRLDKILPAPSKVAKVKHHEAVSVEALPSFIAELSQHESMSVKCLLFTVLTACRSGEARGATWSEIDMQSKVWTIPAERMKAGKEHQVPLSGQAIKLLDSLPRIQDTPYVFPSVRNKPLSDMALSMLMRRMNTGAVPHGFRSTFRDWAGDKTNYPRDLAEAALAHTVSNQVEAAYRRGTALEKRRAMMNEWGKYVFSEMSKKSTPKNGENPQSLKKA